ncbi:hypothetical protein BaRGS_00036610 [Batillaria attramentaria]|uniref:Uncharacterized protein n=1 Tax=Batillaria attramentaria TaxID=370345 RepID=A0ABD0JBN2_9CAEN
MRKIQNTEHILLPETNVRFSNETTSVSADGVIPIPESASTERGLVPWAGALSCRIKAHSRGEKNSGTNSERSGNLGQEFSQHQETPTCQSMPTDKAPPRPLPSVSLSSACHSASWPQTDSPSRLRPRRPFCNARSDWPEGEKVGVKTGRVRNAGRCRQFWWKNCRSVDAADASAYYITPPEP